MLNKHWPIDGWIELVENSSGEGKLLQSLMFFPRAASPGASTPERTADEDLLRQVLFRGHGCHRSALNAFAPQMSRVARKADTASEE